MGVAHRLGSRFFSEIGISIIGAVAHNAAQLVVAYFILVRNQGIFLLFPMMLLAAMATGFLNGLAARFFIRHFKKVSSVNTP
jgi:heptaprenyl diphosphate synthase